MKKIYNFAHGIKQPKSFEVGPFRIEIQDHHCKNLEKLHKRPSYTFTLNDQFERVLQHEQVRVGEIEETAIVHWDNKDITGSFLFPDTPEGNKFFDLLIMLSFLTGRRVYEESELTGHPTKRYIDGAVRNDYFHFPYDFWSSMDDIKNNKYGVPIYNIVQSYVNNDLIGMASYANAALDSVVSAWVKENKSSKYNNKSFIKKSKEKLLDFTRKSLSEKLKIKFISLLSGELEQKIIDDIAARLNFITQPSAIYKLREFLIGIELYPSNASKMVFGRLKWLNMLRNSVAHTGDIPDDKKLGFTKRADISAAITLLTIDIVQYHITANVLKIDKSHCERMKNSICSYFMDGEYRGRNTFDESYEEYMSRVEKEWIESGKLESK